METQTQKKKCSQCLLKLPIHSFGVNSSSSDGYNYTCKSCRNIKRRYHYKKNSIDLNQLPQKFRNKEILKKIDGDKALRTECGQEVNIHFFEKESTVKIHKDNELILALEISDNDVSYVREILDFHLKELDMTLISEHN